MAKKIEETSPNMDNHSKKLLGDMMNDKDIVNTHFNFVHGNKPSIISSGSLKLDIYLKIKSGSVIRMGGPAEVGKSSESLLIAQNYMSIMPKSKFILVNAEAKLTEDMQKRTGMKFVYSPEEWEYGTVFVLQTNIFDTICNIVEPIYKAVPLTGEHIGLIIDSVDMLRLRSSLDQKVSDGKKPAGVNFMTKELLRRLCPYINFYNGLMIMITQYSATFTMSQYEKDAPNLMDGNQTHALNHAAAYALYYEPRSPSHYILENEKEKPDPITNKILGVNAKIRIKKSASDETGYLLEIPIRKGRIGNAIWTEKELFDSLQLMDLLTKKGSWIEINEIVLKWVEESNKPIIEENKEIEAANKNKKKEDQSPLLPLYELKPKHQGLEQFSNYFENNPRICDWLVKKIKTLYS